MAIISGGCEPASNPLHELTLIVLREYQDPLEARWSPTNGCIAVEGRQHHRHGQTGGAILGRDGARAIPEKHKGKHGGRHAKHMPCWVHSSGPISSVPVNYALERHGGSDGTAGKERDKRCSFHALTDGRANIMHALVPLSPAYSI